MKPLAILACFLFLLILSSSFFLTVKAETEYSSLGISKQYFLYTMNEELDYYNYELDTSVTLYNTGVYRAMPNQKDGWQYTFSNEISFVEVGGPDSDLEEAYFLAAIPEDITDNEISEFFTEICAFTAVLWDKETVEYETAYSWIFDQIINGDSGFSQKVGNKIITTISTTLYDIPCLAIGVVGEEVITLPPWWTFLGIASGTIGISTFIYRLYIHFKKKNASKGPTQNPTDPLPPPPP